MLTVRLTRLSNTHHRMAVVRADGSGEAQDFETRAALRHDLLHFSLETEAGLENSFFGLLAKGATFEELAGKVMGSFAPGVEAGVTERIVGPLSGAADGTVEIPAFIQNVQHWFAAQGDTAPEWLTPDLLERVKERYRRLYGQWKATQFGDTMELTFAPKTTERSTTNQKGTAS